MPHGRELLAFAQAAHHAAVDALGDTPELTAARAALEAAVGPEGVIEAAATIAAFNGLVRVADGTGIQLDAGVLADSADFRDKFGVDRYAGADNTETRPEHVDRTDVMQLFR